jgi:hypothetical protein
MTLSYFLCACCSVYYLATVGLVLAMLLVHHGNR